MRFRPPSRLGLRARVTVMFTLGALVLSTAMGLLAFLTTRQALIDARHSTSLRQAYANASLLRTTLLAGSTSVDPLLVIADTGTGSNSVLELKTIWYARSGTIGEDELPTALRKLVLGGAPATQTFSLRGTPQIAVGIPLPAVHGAYFEVFNVGDLDHTLGVLAFALLLAGFVTTVLGAGIGRFASGRSLRPLQSVSQAAVAIAGGDLGTRLEISPEDPELSALAASFNAMVDQLRERIEREVRFASDVSHELRSPLTTLSASLSALEAERENLPERPRRAVDLLSFEVRRFERMVADLLEISRSDTGAADLSIEEVPVGELVERAVAAATASNASTATAPPVEIDPGLADAWIGVDKRRFGRIMANLLENAAHYAGGATRVHVSPAAQPETVRIAVEDEGPGIDPAESTRVFARFYRGSSAGRRGLGAGSGLGLALVQEHVRLHGGRVYVESTAKGGACFVIELPLVPMGEIE